MSEIKEETPWWKTTEVDAETPVAAEAQTIQEDKPWWESSSSQDVKPTQSGEVGTEVEEEDELTTAQSIKNSLSNFGEQLGDVFEVYGLKEGEEGGGGAQESFDIAWNALKSGILGPSESTTEEILSSLKAYDIEKQAVKQTKGVYESIEKGDIGGAFAGAFNAVVNGIGSAAYNIGTGFTGFLADYSAENYIEFNKLKAKNLNKSFNDLVKEGDADVAIPLGIAAVQSGMETYGLGKIMKVVGGKGGLNPLSSFGKELATKALYNKSARTTLSIIGTGSTEFVTEISQYAAGEVNKELGRVAGTDEEAKIKDTIIEAITSPVGLENGIQGFIGGSGMASGSYSARAVSAARNVVSSGDIEADMLAVVKLNKEIKEEESKDNYDADVLEGKKETLKQRKIALSDKKKKGNDTYLKMEDDQVLEVEDKDTLANIAAYKLTELNKKLDSGQITQAEYDAASEGFTETYNKAKARINEIIYEADQAKAEEISKETGLNVKKSATEQEYADDIIKDQSADNESDPNNFNNEKELDDFIAQKPRKNASKKAQEKRTAAINLKEKIEGVKTSGGLFSGQGKIFINEKLSKAQGDVSINTHEVLHPILNALVGNRSEQGKIVKQLKKVATWNQRRYVAQQLRTRKVAKEDHDTEWINILSDGITKGEIGFDKNVFEKMGDAFKSIFGAKQVSTVGFEDGQQVYNFIKEYTSTSPDGAASKIALKAIKDAEAKAKVKIKDVGGLGGSQASNLNQVFEAMHPEKAKESVSDFMDTILVDKKTGVKTDDVSNTPFADQVGGMIGSIINRTYNNVKDPNSYTKADYKRDLLNEAILLVKNEYNPELKLKNGSNVDLDKFLSNRLNLRANNLIDRLGERGDVKTESMTRQMAGADEGTPARQFASDELSPLESMIEVQDELESQDNSIRKELEIEDGSSIYNEVIALVKEEISNIKGVIKQSDILSIKNKLVKTFGKALQKTLKNKIGGDKEHRAFVKKYSLVIYNKFTTKQLTALARELGNDNYFTYRPLGDKKLSYSQALAAQNMDLIEVKNLKSGPVLRLKYNISEETDSETSITPETVAERFNEYFFPPAINPVTGERSSKKGTRKDAMARNIGAEMAFDAVMQVLTSPEVVQFRASKLSSEYVENTDIGLEELDGFSIDNIVSESISKGETKTEQEVADQIAKEQLKSEVAILSKAISRDPGFQFSNIAEGLSADQQKQLNNNTFSVIKELIGAIERSIIKGGKVTTDFDKVSEEFRDLIKAIFPNVQDRISDYIPESKRQLAAKVMFLGLGAKIEILEERFIKTFNNGSKKLDSAWFNFKTKVGTKQLRLKDMDAMVEQASNLVATMPVEFRDLLVSVLGESAYAQALGQHYRIIDSAKVKRGSITDQNKKGIQGEGFKAFDITRKLKSIKELRKGLNEKTDKTYIEFLNKLEELLKVQASLDPITGVKSQIKIDGKQRHVENLKNRTGEKRSEYLEENKDAIASMNQANKLAFEALALFLRSGYERETIDQRYVLGVLFGQTNAIGGFRGFSQLQGVSLDGDLEMGEHANINAKTMVELLEFIVSPDTAMELDRISSKHTQILLSKKQSKEVDKNGKTNLAGIQRFLGLESKIQMIGSATDLLLNEINQFASRFVTTSKVENQSLNGIQESKIANKIANDSGSNVDFNKSNFSKLTNLPEYKKFVKALKGKKLYRGGGQIQPGKKATWWYVDDKSDALFISEKFTDDIAKKEGYETIYGPMKKWTKEVMDKFDPYLNTLTSDINKIGKNALILPDINVENQGFKNWFKNNFPNEYKKVINAFHRIPFTDRVFNGVLDIKDILKQGNAEQILIGYIKHIAKNGQPTSYFDRFKRNKTINIYNKNEGMPVVVLGDIEASSLQFSNNKKETTSEDTISPASQGFNQILEQTKGVKEDETFSETVARQKGATIGKYKFFVPPSAEDFMGLIYSFLTKGKIGDTQKQFFETYLNAPYKRGIAQMESAKQKIEDDYRKLRKKFKSVSKKLGKKIPELKGTKLEDFTYDQAVRIYLWDYSTGFENVAEKTGLDESDIKKLAAIVQNDTELTQFARGLGLLTGLKEGYIQPTKTWLTDNIASDLSNIVDKINRKEFLSEFIQNKNEIFSKENLNKIEAIYGSNFREAMQDMLFRMENGTNRNFGENRLVNQFSNWINNSVGAIMFFNMRSAVLQIISSVNFLNWNDNNPLSAAIAFANQPQFWSDFALIFNSDKLKQRRKGLKIDVNQAELANSVADSKNKAKAALRYLLKIGFAPTQIADSFAIAVGGASMYRNRVNTYKKQGMSIEKAEQAAFEDFGAIAEETQQSSDPSLVSQQQSGPLGRLILAFQNTPMQYARLIKKSVLDLANGRGDAKTHISKIVYYMAIQNIIFSSMQTALFAMMFNDDDDDEEMKDQIDRKEKMVLHGMLDTLIRGTGIGGAAVVTIKNAIREYNKQEDKEYGRDHAYTLMQLVNVSPPIGSKLRKVYSAIQTNRFDQDVIDAKGFALDSPIYRVGGNLISAATNLPADRLVNKLNNVTAALDNQNKTWQRIAMALGWNSWDLNVKNEEHELIKANAKDARRKEGYKKATKTRDNKRKNVNRSELIKQERQNRLDKLRNK